MEILHVKEGKQLMGFSMATIGGLRGNLKRGHVEAAAHMRKSLPADSFSSNNQRERMFKPCKVSDTTLYNVQES